MSHSSDQRKNRSTYYCQRASFLCLTVISMIDVMINKKYLLWTTIRRKKRENVGIWSKHGWGVSQIPLPCFYCFYCFYCYKMTKKTGKLGENSHTGGRGGGVHPRGKISPDFPFFRSNCVPKLVSRCPWEPDQNADK